MAFENGHLGAYNAATGQFESAARLLTDVEKAALQAEATANPEARPYRDSGGTLTDAGTLCLLVNGSYLTPNSVTSAPRITLETVSKHEFGVFMGTMMGRILSTGNAALISKWTAQSNALLPFVNFQDYVPVASVTIQGVLAELVSDGIADQTADVDLFDKTPDPAWAADTLHPARASIIFDTPLTLEPADWEGIN